MTSPEDRLAGGGLFGLHRPIIRLLLLMHRSFYLILVGSVLAWPVCAQNSTPAVPITETFEQPGLVPSAEFLPSRLLSSPLHQVEAQAYHDGLHLSYRLQSPQGTETVVGTLPLVNRLREIRAVAHLEQLNRTEEFTKALVQAGQDKVQSVANLVKDPVGTVKRLPAGASRFFGRISESIQQAEHSTPDGKALLASALGIQRKKFQLAMELGVSPFSSNPMLQSQLSSTARAMAGGALVVGVAGMAVDGGAGAALSVIGINQTLQQTLVESTPEDLQIANRQILLSLGVPAATVERFLMNPWFSPWQETLMSNSLKEIGINPTALIQQAAESFSEQDALYFIQLTRLYHKRHIDLTPLQSFRIEQGLLCALDAKGTLVVAISADYLIWTPLVKQRATEFATLTAPDGPIRALTLMNDGAISARAAEELANRQIPTVAYWLGPIQ